MKPSPLSAARIIEFLTLQNLFCINCLIPRFDLGLVVQNHVQQGIMDFQFSVVFDKTQFAELVHEKAHSRSGRADHLRQRFLSRRAGAWEAATVVRPVNEGLRQTFLYARRRTRSCTCRCAFSSHPGSVPTS
jgi:hypothetical protein